MEQAEVATSGLKIVRGKGGQRKVEREKHSHRECLGRSSGFTCVKEAAAKGQVTDEQDFTHLPWTPSYG